MVIFQDVATRLRGETTAPSLDWTAVYESEFPRVFNFFVYRVRNSVVAEDLTAQVFEKAWSRRERYHEQGRFSAWLMTIARNLATDHFRTRHAHLPIEAAAAAKDPSDPAGDLEAKERRERLQALIGRLPENHQELIALKYGAELSNGEIGRVMKLSESNVGTILHRLIVQLRGEWEAER